MVRQQRLLGFALTLAYGLVAVAGHSLHSLLPCDDPGCHQSVAACDCGICEVAEANHEADETAHQASGPQFKGQNNGHDPHSCPLCILLAKVKYGDASFDFSTISIAVSTPDSLIAPFFRWDESLSNHAPRGPPVG